MKIVFDSIWKEKDVYCYLVNPKKYFKHIIFNRLNRKENIQFYYLFEYLINYLAEKQLFILPQAGKAFTFSLMKK
jgi:hypothetical protein